MNLRPPNESIVIRQLQRLDAETITAGARGLKRGLEFARGVITQKFLSGPRPKMLGVRTGQLRRSIAVNVEMKPGVGVIGTIGSNIPYASFHEFGFRGEQRVKAHSRIVRQVNSKGDDIDPRRRFVDDKGNFIGFRETRGRANQRRVAHSFTQQVRAHRRKINYAGRPFIRPALELTKESIGLAVREELAKIPPTA